MLDNRWKLKWMAWEITRRCNMACVHCRSSSESSSTAGLFNIERAKGFIDDIAQFTSPVIVLSGGEPMLHPNFFDIAKLGADKGFRMAMATNGSLITDEACKKIKDSGIQIAALSLDGATAAVHDDFRGQAGTFSAVSNAATLFRKYDIKFIINSSFTKRNQQYIGDTMRLAKEMGAKAWYMFLIVPTGRGEDIMSELISKEDYEDILRWHYELEQAEDELLMRPTCAPQYYRIWHEMGGADRRSLTFSTGGGKGCVAAQSIALVTCEGEVFPCSYFPVSAGNVFNDSFQNIWDSSTLFNELRDFNRYEGKCGACNYLDICGGCRARAYAINGSYLAEEPFCGYRA